jgi:hypothetical protein
MEEEDRVFRRAIEFDALDVFRVKNQDLIEQVHQLNLEAAAEYEQAPSVTELLRTSSIGLRIVGPVCDMSKGALGQVEKRSLTERLPRGRHSILTDDHIECIALKV